MNLARIWKDNDDLEIRLSRYKAPQTLSTDDGPKCHLGRRPVAGL